MNHGKKNAADRGMPQSRSNRLSATNEARIRVHLGLGEGDFGSLGADVGGIFEPAGSASFGDGNFEVLAVGGVASFTPGLSEDFGSELGFALGGTFGFSVSEGTASFSLFFAGASDFAFGWAEPFTLSLLVVGLLTLTEVDLVFATPPTGM